MNTAKITTADEGRYIRLFVVGTNIEFALKAVVNEDGVVEIDFNAYQQVLIKPLAANKLTIILPDSKIL